MRWTLAWLHLMAAVSTSRPVAKVEPHPRLVALPPQTALVVSEGYKGDHGVLAYSGIVYDHHRHKMLAFGGGHATGRFPNSVHEFDLQTLTWSQLTPDVPPSAYSKENSVRDRDGVPLGGVRYEGKIWPASRHTYDGLVMAPDR